MEEDRRIPVPDPTLLTTDAISREINALRDLLETVTGVRFDAVDLQFRLIERQRVESKIDTQKAIDAALTSQEKAAAILAVGTAEQLKQIQLTFGTALAAVNTLLSETRDRQSVTEREVSGIEKTKQGGREAFSTLQLIIGLILGFIALAGFLYSTLPHK